MPADNEPVYRSTVDNYDFSSIDGIEADIAAMEQFAAGLKADLVDNYMPHADAASDAMLAELPSGGPFYDLHLFMYFHQQAQDATQVNIENYVDGTYRFATAAEEISSKYRGADAFSRAKLSDVQAGFQATGENMDHKEEQV